MIDLDGEGHEKQLAEIQKVLEGIIRRAYEKGIYIHVEVSSSGKGYHVWYFFVEKVYSLYAREVGRSLLPPKVKCIEKKTGKVVIEDKRVIEVFPKSESCQSVGTMSWLPLNYRYCSEINNKFIDKEAFCDRNIVIDNLHIVYLNKSNEKKAYIRPNPSGSDFNVEACGDFMEIINGCPSLHRLWSSSHIGHEGRVILMSLAVNTSNGSTILKSRWPSDETDYQIKKAFEKKMKPYTCNKIQSCGFCEVGKDPLLYDQCFKKYKNKNNKEVEPSPVRLRSGARKVLSKSYLSGGKEMSW